VVAFSSIELIRDISNYLMLIYDDYRNAGITVKPYRPLNQAEKRY
jgi:hypothetical protein